MDEENRNQNPGRQILTIKFHFTPRKQSTGDGTTLYWCFFHAYLMPGKKKKFLIVLSWFGKWLISFIGKS